MAIRAGGATDRPTGGKRDILGLWIGNGGEGAKNWLQVLTEIENRGLRRGPTGRHGPRPAAGVHGDQRGRRQKRLVVVHAT